MIYYFGLIYDLVKVLHDVREFDGAIIMANGRTRNGTSGGSENSDPHPTHPRIDCFPRR